MMRQTRRRFVIGAFGVTIGAVAGCFGSTDTDSASRDDGRTAQVSFVVSDFITHVANRSMTVTNLVPFGQHGHGWEPGSDI